MTLKLPGKPNLSFEAAKKILDSNGVKGQIALLGIRAFFSQKNQIGVYDDAIFLLTPSGIMSFNANTDPARHRPGHGTQDGVKGMATLAPGVYPYQAGFHKGAYVCLVQAGDVTVHRDADDLVPDSKVKMVDGRRVYEETGRFGIHIHKGGYNQVSSEGCQTIHPDYWDSFIGLVLTQLDIYRQKTLPYCLSVLA